MTTYKFLDAVAKIGSIRKAADQLAITPSALNRRILSVEEEFGTQLFERLPHGLRLNTAGELVIDHVRRQMSDLHRIQSQIADIGGERRGHVTIACSQAAYLKIIPSAVVEYQRQHPFVTFDIRTCEATEAIGLLSNYTVDLAYVFGAHLDGGVQVLHQSDCQLYACLSKYHPLADASDPVGLAECAQFPLALLRRGGGNRSLLDFEADKQGLTLSPSIESDNLSALTEICQRSHAVSFRVSNSIGTDRKWIDEPITLRPLQGKTTGANKLSLMQLKGRTLSVAASRFAETLSRLGA